MNYENNYSDKVEFQQMQNSVNPAMIRTTFHLIIVLLLFFFSDNKEVFRLVKILNISS